MWTYYRVIDGSYVRLDPDTYAADEFDPADGVWEEMDAWYGEIVHNGGPAIRVPDEVALAATEARFVRAATRD